MHLIINDYSSIFAISAKWQMYGYNALDYDSDSDMNV